ncbi:MAG TPA: rhomboid family intramembrane serine protease [Actinomycetota bacterium]
MLPIRDDNPASGIGYVTIALIALNVIAFLFWEPTFASGPTASLRSTTFFLCHAEIPYEVHHRTNLADGGAGARAALSQAFGQGTGGDVQRYLKQACPNKNWFFAIFTAMFLHAGWLHIGGNMLFLWVFGNNVEDKIGRIRYLLFYLAAGVVATLGQLLTGPNSAVPNLGASGAIAGVLGAYLVMFPRRRVLTLVFFFIITWIYLPAVAVLGIWFVLQAFSGVAALSQNVHTGGVAYFAHIGGFAFGALLALAFFPKEGFRRRPPPARPDMPRGFRWRRRPPPPAWPGEASGWPAS